MSPQRYVRIVLYLLGLGFFGLIVSCSAIPDRAAGEGTCEESSAGAATPTSEGSRVEAEDTATENALPEGTVLGGPPPEAREAPGAFRLVESPEDATSLEFTSWRGDGPAESEGASHAESVPRSAAGAAEEPGRDDSDGALRQVGARLAQDYGQYVGGLGDTGTLGKAAETERLVAAARLVAWSFVGSAWSADEPLLVDAMDALLKAEAPVELQLLAAAGLERLGRTREAREVLREAYPEIPAKPLTEANGGVGSSDVFSLTSVTFARSIDGPRDFEPTNPGVVPPGQTVLIYGEFTNSAYEERPDSTPSGAPAHHHSFVAYLQLVTPSGEELDRVDFLPEDRGRHVSKERDDPINFWVRYVVPTELRHGSYLLRIHATDLVTERYATAELELLVGRSGPLYGSGS